MRYRRVLTAFASTPLALMPEKIAEVRAFLELKAGGGDVPEEDVERLRQSRRRRHESFIAAVNPDPQAAQQFPGAVVRGRIAVLPVHGVLAQRVGMMEEASGGISTEAIGAALDSLVRDNSIKSIVLSVDSPGGQVFGVEELASKIRAYRDSKKIVGIADSIAGSAGFWILAQASEVNITPSGMLGSVGTYVAHTDTTKMEEMLGVKTTLVSSSPEKVELAPETPLTDEARAELQRTVGVYNAKFVSSLAKGRGVTETRVNADFGNGRMFTAQEAVQRGMADKVSTLEQVLRRLGAESVSAGARAQVELTARERRAKAARARVLELNQD